jgi:hypothetical protein
VQLLSDDPQESQVQQSGDPQGSFSPFWHFFNIYECIFYLMIPKSPMMNQGGISIIIFYILTLVCLSWMQIWSKVFNNPTSNPAGILKDPFDTFSPFSVDSLSEDPQ